MSDLRATLAGMLHERDGFGDPAAGAECTACLLTVDLLLPAIDEHIEQRLADAAARDEGWPTP